MVFQPVYRCLKKIGNTDHISAWKSKGLSDESIRPPATSCSVIKLYWCRPSIKFDRQCLRQDKVKFNLKNLMNIYIFYEINLWPFKQSVDVTSRNFLFGAVKLTKNSTDFKRYKYFEYRIGLTLNFFVNWW